VRRLPGAERPEPPSPLAAVIAARLPDVDLVDVLIDVDAWTALGGQVTGTLRSGAPGARADVRRSRAQGTPRAPHAHGSTAALGDEPRARHPQPVCSQARLRPAAPTRSRGTAHPARRSRGLATLDRRGGWHRRRAGHAPDPIEAELRPLARADPRVGLLVTVPGIGDLLGLTIASEIGDVSRFSSARKLVGYSGLTPRVYQSGEKSRTSKLSMTGSTMLRWAAIEAAQQAWRPNNPWQSALPRRQGALRRQGQPRQGRRRAQGPNRQLARAIPPAALHSFAPARCGSSCSGELQLRSGRLTAHRELSSRDSSDRHGVRRRAPKEN
jgi:hypothetical protein